MCLLVRILDKRDGGRMVLYRECQSMVNMMFPIDRKKLMSIYIEYTLESMLSIWRHID